jgi:4-nitrophenyl phosphatase
MGKIAALLFDLDGTIYRGGDAIPGACEFIASLQRRNISYLFVTNRGNRRPELVAKQILSIGIPCCAENVLTSSQVVATHLEKGTRAYCIGEEGLTSILEDHGIRVLEDATEEADAVIVSYDRDFNYDKLSKATRLIKAGARFIATNTDKVITVEDGILPEAGPLVAAVQNATGKEPEIIGKPERYIIDAACVRLNKSADESVIIGDNLFTDILAGHKSGMRSALMLTGVTTRRECDYTEFKPTWIAEDYLELEKLFFSE